jgi:hypothetical protein
MKSSLLAQIDPRSLIEVDPALLTAYDQAVRSATT